MPIEIKELVIRAVVVSPADKGASAAKPSAPAREPAAASGNDEVVQACVREVLRILKRAEER